MAGNLVAQLLEAGLVTQQQIRDTGISDHPAAPSSGRVAQQLVAHGLDEDALAGFFVSRGFGPLLHEHDLSRAEEDLVRKLPGDLAHLLFAVPLRGSPAGVIVAMADPTDESATADVSQALDGSVLPMVARLSDLTDALQRLYPADRPTLISDPLALMREQEDQTQTQPTDDIAFEELVATASPVWDRAWDSTHSSPQVWSSGPPPDSLRSDTEQSPAPRFTPGAKQIDLSVPIATLRSVTSRDELVRVGCEACLDVARSAAFLALRKGVLRGWHGIGAGVAPASIRSLWVPASNPSMLSDVLQTGQTFVGPYGQTAADHLFRAALGGQGREAAIVPVLIGTRLCGLLCANDPTTGTGADLIGQIAAEMGEAFQRLILSQKADI